MYQYATIEEFITNELGKSGVSIKNTIVRAYEFGLQQGGNTIIGPTLEEARERLVEAIVENAPEDEEDLDEEDLDSEDDGIG